MGAQLFIRKPAAKFDIGPSRSPQGGALLACADHDELFAKTPEGFYGHIESLIRRQGADNEIEIARIAPPSAVEFIIHGWKNHEGLSTIKSLNAFLHIGRVCDKLMHAGQSL